MHEMGGEVEGLFFLSGLWAGFAWAKSPDHVRRAGARWANLSCLSPFVSVDLLSAQACGGSIQTSVNALSDDVLGRCEVFEETQIGGER